jgi:2-polyprenyl-3-methyl-5-hydroxy-6-metoxy-1,4-benzoquinol methylase
VKGVRRGLRRLLNRFGYDVVHRGAPVAAGDLTALDAFVDEEGRRHRRLQGFRELVAPHWRGMYVEPDAAAKPADVAAAREGVRRADAFLRPHGTGIAGRDVLEIGCHAGAHAFAMEALGARRVCATDVCEYGVRQTQGRTADEQVALLEALRASTARHFERAQPSRVEFAFVDASDMAYRDEFDLVVSWETLEHLTRPQEALARMQRALRPGGHCFHEYNPFFCFSGGHSLATLDFPYAHVLLSSADFERYVRTYRPDELEMARAFFERSLNRMTLADLADACERAGFETLARVPWVVSDSLRWIGPDTLARAQQRYPGLTALDLMAHSVWVLLRKPESL